MKFLCAEMGEAFRAAGRSLPPWRAEKSMLSKWLPARSADVLVSPNASAGSSSAGSSGAGVRAIHIAAGGAACGNGSGSGEDAQNGGSCSPVSPLQAASKRQRVPAAAVNSAQRPLAVQTGFSVAPGASLLSRELGLQRLQPAAAGAKADGRCGGQKVVRFAADGSTVTCGGGQGSRHGVRATRAAAGQQAPASGPFDMWAPSRRSGAGAVVKSSVAADDSAPHAGMPAIRTVKMIGGKCR